MSQQRTFANSAHMMLRWPTLKREDVAYFFQAAPEAVDIWVAESTFPKPVQQKDGERVWTQFQFRTWIDSNRLEIRAGLEARRAAGRNVPLVLDLLTREGKAFEGCPKLSAE